MKLVRITVEIPNGDHVSPYPYLVFKNSCIGDQDIWQGTPAFLLGFSKESKAGEIDLLFKKFWAKPKKAKGMYPVFRTSTEQWYTEKLKVIKTEVLKSKPKANGILKPKEKKIIV